MRERYISVPQLILFAGTRVALGVGIGMLLAGRLNRDVRKGAGVALIAVGALTTVPLLIGIARRPQLVDPLGAGSQAA